MTLDVPSFRKHSINLKILRKELGEPINACTFHFVPPEFRQQCCYETAEQEEYSAYTEMQMSSLSVLLHCQCLISSSDTTSSLSAGFRSCGAVLGLAKRDTWDLIMHTMAYSYADFIHRSVYKTVLLMCSFVAIYWPECCSYMDYCDLINIVLCSLLWASHRTSS